MSDQGDPFERNNKTVLRLNPGGRRPTPAPVAPQPSAPPPYQPPPPWPGSPPPPPAPITGPYSGGGYQPPPPPSAPPGQQDAWFTPPPVAPPPSAASGGALILKRDVPIAANANLLLEAAGPLLLLLGRLRTSLMSANFANLMEQVADAVEEFDKTMRLESVPSATADDAKYVLCATCDDIVQNIPSEQRHVWAQYSMLSRFFGERTGGVRFFEKLDKAKQDPATNYDLLELIYACLAIGFQGIHRTTGAAATLQAIHRNTYELLRRARPRSREDLSPHWRGQELPRSGSTFRIPLWALAGVAALALFGVFVTLRIMLSGNTEVVTAEMGRMFPDTQLGLERAAVAVPAPPVPVKASTQLERIRARLKTEIDQNKVDPVESGQSIIIRVGAFTLFESGQATVRPDFEPIAQKIADALQAEPGEIRITGHTDNVRIVTARFPSNYELSVERATAVANVLKGRISQPERLKTEGKGDAVPLASNQTAEGRGRNRRVDISLPREETLKTASR